MNRIPREPGTHAPPTPIIGADPDSSGPHDPATAELFEQHRRRLWGIAYGIVGSAEDADDLVQETYLRWHSTDPTGVARPEAWLVTALTRLAIDRLRRRKVERNAYTGPWLPTPLVAAVEPADRAAEIASELSLALLLVMERLTPEERTAFLLREVFGAPYAEIAEVLASSEAACRQLVHRARKHVRSGKPKYRPEPSLVRSVAVRFSEAVQNDDYEDLVSVLSADASLVTDGGGKVWAALRPVHGADRVARAILGAARKRREASRLEYRIASVNGSPGVITYQNGVAVAATELQLERGRIRAVLTVLNPVKLTHLREPAAGSVAGDSPPSDGAPARKPTRLDAVARPSARSDRGSSTSRSRSGAGTPADSERRCKAASEIPG